MNVWGGFALPERVDHDPDLKSVAQRIYRKLPHGPIVLALLLGGCSLITPKPDKVVVSIPEQTWWSTATTSSDTSTRNLALARERMADVVSLRFTLGLSDQTEINAFASKKDGQTLVVYTQGFLKEFGNDPDVLATTLGHELAHHQLGHTDPDRQRNRLLAQEIAAQALGTLASYFVPFSGLLVGPAVKTASLTFSRDDEREADALGLQWALQAGYSPCGSYRLANRLTDLGKDQTLVFLSTHPGNSERAENTQIFMQTKGLPACGTHP